MSFSLARAARESVDPICASGGLFKIEQFAVRLRVMSWTSFILALVERCFSLNFLAALRSPNPRMP